MWPSKSIAECSRHTIGEKEAFGQIRICLFKQEYEKGCRSDRREQSLAQLDSLIMDMIPRSQNVPRYESLSRMVGKRVLEAACFLNQHTAFGFADVDVGLFSVCRGVRHKDHAM